MKSILDQTIFNSVDPNALAPKVSKPLPFPLENFDQELSSVYDQLYRLRVKAQAAKKNPVNETPARKKHITQMEYKLKTALKLIEQVSISGSRLWF